MGAFWLLGLLIATLSLAQQMEPLNMCSQETTIPACILTFTPWMAPQVAPTSTYYEAIVTKHLNIIDCRYCSVTNVEDNPTPTGFFTEKVTSSMLTATRVTCMIETTAITRRDYRGYPEIEELGPRTIPPTSMIRRDLVSEPNLAGDVAEDVDPGNWETIQAINEYRKQIYSAVMAVNLILSGLDLQWMCDALRNSSLKLSLSQQNLYPDQIGNLVCYSARYGIMFDGTTFQVLDQLTTASTSLLLAVQNNFNATAAAAQLCNDLNLDNSLYTMLHIDNRGIYTVLCTGLANGTSTLTASGTLPSLISASASASTEAVTYTSWGVNGSVIITGTAVGVTWSNQGGTGGASATLAGSTWTVGAGNITGTAVSTGGVSIGTAGSLSWSAGGEGSAVTSAAWTAISASLSAVAGGNGSASTGSGPISASTATPASLAGNGTMNTSAVASTLPESTSLPGNATVGPTATATSTGTALSWSFEASANGSVSATATAWPPATSGPATGGPSPTWSWTTSTNANESVIISGTAVATGPVSSWESNNLTSIATATGVSVSTAVGTGATVSWASTGGNTSTVFSYSGVAWTSWVVGSNPTVAIITGTAGTIEWGTAGASVLITGAGQAATFTIYQVTKTIFVTATAIAQTWSAYGANTAGIIAATGTSGTWTFEAQSLTAVSPSVTTVAGTGVSSSLANGSTIPAPSIVTGTPDFGNVTLTPPSNTTTSDRGSNISSVVSSPSISGNPSFSILTTSNDGNVSIPGVPHGTGIPFVPSNLTTASIASATTFATTGFVNFTTSLVGTAVTSLPGNTTAVINATTLATTVISNVSTTVIGTVVQSSFASVGTGIVTLTNPENGTNITLSISPPTFSTPKSFSYPAWTTSTTSGDAWAKV